MFHGYFASLGRRSDKSQTRLGRCLAPGAIAVFERLVVRPRAVHQIQFDFGVQARCERLLVPRVLAIDHDPVRALAHGAPFATDDGQAEELVFRGRRIGSGPTAPAAQAGGVLERVFVFLRGEAPGLAMRPEIDFPVAGTPLQADPVGQFGAVKMSVRIESDGGGRAVLEFQVGRIGAFHAAGWIGDNGRAADATHHAASQHPHDVELDRALAQHQAALQRRRIEFFAAAGPVQPFIVIAGGDHDRSSQHAATDDLDHFEDAAVETLRMANQQPHTVAFGGADHRVAIIQRQRHRLIGDYLLAVLRSDDGVFGVQRIGREDVDGVDVRSLAQLLDAGIGPAAVAAGERIARFRARVGRGDELDIGMAGQTGRGC